MGNADPAYRTLLTAMVELDLELTDRLASLLYCATNLREEADGRGLCFCENIDMVRGHALLSDEDLLRTIDDEVTSGVIRALVEVKKLLVP